MLHGGVDGVNPASTSEGQAPLFLNRYERKVLPECGHFPQREAPEQVAQELIRFLAS
jgi:pimeloyl-ACP methyl ester carboxylesterase